MIRSGLKRIYYKVIIRFFSNESRCSIGEKEDNVQLVLDDSKKFVENYSEVSYISKTIILKDSTAKYKWVGAQYLNDQIICIPNDETKVLFIDKKFEYKGDLSNNTFKWTGGVVWDGSVYAFPRSANSFLKINDREIKEIILTEYYEKEHHYSGVCTRDGVVYQSPRNTNHILKTDLKTGVSKKIYIVNEKFKVKLRYCGNIIHPNGFIYFFPEQNGRVIELNPKTDKWRFVGKTISTMCFEAKIGLDGNIYGYSAYCSGIMKIDVLNDKVEMIHKEIKPGAYGTKYGIDGCLYSIPGNGTKIYKYNVLKDSISILEDLNDYSNAKYAGGVTTPNGDIICVPATSKKILLLKPNKKINIPNKIYNVLFSDNY